MSFLAKSPFDRGAAPRRESRHVLLKIVGFKLCLLDFVIALGRKVGGFFALLTLGWTYFRILFLGQSLHQLYPDAPDPDLRQTLWVGLLLIMAQGWDISTDRIATLWDRLRSQGLSARSLALPSPPVLLGVRNALEPLIVRLGRFMDLCVAIANKIGAFAVLCYLVFIGAQFWGAGVTIREMYPNAGDPHVSLLADLCVYVVVLGWWAMPFEQIRAFWQRLRQPVEVTTTDPISKLRR